jgi:predicted DNA-binding helix-hairpin-helix protein
MTASRDQLLRVPGIGPVGADAILRARRLGRLTDLTHLRQLQIRAPEQAASYILLDGARPVLQMRLFP